MPVILALRSPRQEKYACETSLGYTERPLCTEGVVVAVAVVAEAAAGSGVISGTLARLARASSCSFLFGLHATSIHDL